MCLFLKRGLVHSISHENEFYLHVNENSFPYARLSTKICFEKEAQDNLENMAYSYKYNCGWFMCQQFSVFIPEGTRKIIV